ncbi:MAG: hypothetical protein HKN68_03865 [Saprospiraceae bacterium]|nr:hypothetical protein [Saprospiraceae bacterium]
MIDYYKIKESSDIEPQLQGKGLRKCLFILSESDYKEGENKLGEILKAVKLDKNKDILLWLTETDDLAGLQSIIQKYGVEIITSFGFNLSEFYKNMVIQDYQLLHMENHTWLPAPSLVQVLSSRDEKMKLWKALQSLFLK